MENLGWIKLQRKLLDDPVFSNPHLFHLLSYCLLKANHKDNKFLLGGKIIELKRGQFVTGRKSLAKQLKINENTLYYRLKTLEKLKYINLKSNNEFTILTIINYNTYQDNTLEVQQGFNNPLTSVQQPFNTNKNDKNDKNEKKNKGADIFPVHFSGNFIKAWNKWLDYREEIKKPLKNATRKSQMDFLKTYNEAEAIAIIMQSIRNGWQGLFEINKQTHGTKTNFSKASADEKFGDEFKAGQLRALGSLLEGRN